MRWIGSPAAAAAITQTTTTTAAHASSRHKYCVAVLRTRVRLFSAEKEGGEENSALEGINVTAAAAAVESRDASARSA